MYVAVQDCLLSQTVTIFSSLAEPTHKRSAGLVDCWLPSWKEGVGGVMVPAREYTATPANQTYAVLPNDTWSQVGWLWPKTSAEDLKCTMPFLHLQGI